LRGVNLMDNKRLFPRCDVNLGIKFDFVKWNERRVNRCKNTFEANSVDISAQGVGFSELPEIGEGILKQLHTGKKKIRLTFTLNPDHQPVNTFARLVWEQDDSMEISDEKAYGFEFIDIPKDSFDEIKSFVREKI